MAFSLPGFRHDPVAHVVEDTRSTLSARDPIEDLTNAFGETDLSENIFADILDRTYGPSGGDRNQWRRTPAIEDGFSIDFSRDRSDRHYCHDSRSHNQEPEFHRTSGELMNTLDKHAGKINIGRHNEHITRDELKNYLVRVGDNISPQDKADLLLIMRDFNNIGDKGHFYAAGADLPLSQEEFKAYYKIPHDMDLTKFMRGKDNDGKVPNFWTSAVAAGLGGRDDNNNLRWDNAGYHEASLDFQRNFAQLAEFFDKLSLDKQEEFTFNFARTQSEVLRSNGVSLLAADNEKIHINEEGVTKVIDLVEKVGSDRKLLQWA
ncbi:MAG: hypothetical protein IT342_24595 [Candidatus Melainabacteria bacterium]|nr:hypothetical protein [Candidatus Melainabacteria bacterium]